MGNTTRQQGPTAGTDERPNDDQIKAWKKDHGKVYRVYLEDRKLLAYFRQPKIADLERAMKASKLKNAKEMDFNRSIIGNCLLYNDPGFRQSDEAELALLTAVNDVVNIAEAEVKEV